MKNYLGPGALALVTLFGLILSTSRGAEAPPLIAYPVKTGGLNENAVILRKHAASSATVLQALGEPGAKLSPEVWVYWDFQSAQPNRTEGLDTLVLEFRNDRLFALKLVNGGTVRRFIAVQDQLDPARLLTPLYAVRTPARK